MILSRKIEGGRFPKSAYRRERSSKIQNREIWRWYGRYRLICLVLKDDTRRSMSKWHVSKGEKTKQKGANGVESESWLS